MDQIINVMISAEPGSVLKSGIKVLHLVGIVLGLGAATVLDLIIVRFLVVGNIKAEHAVLVEFLSKIVTAGLAVLWLSGSLYLLHYYSFDPSKLMNQKIWAKIAIVGVLTINGYFIHHRVLPLVRAQVGGTLFRGLSENERALMLIFGTISATSWYVPLVLGALPQLNVGVAYPTILLLYTTLLLLAITSTQRVVRMVLPLEPDTEIERGKQELKRRVAMVVGNGGGSPGFALSAPH